MTRITTPDKPRAATHAAEIVREYGPLPGTDRVAGVTHDGRNVWAATGARLFAFDPATGEAVRSIECACDAGTAFDGKHLWQVAETRIDKIDPETGKVLASLPTPSNAGGSGLAWAEGSLWLGLHRGRKIVQIDPATGEVKRTIESNRFVTGVTGRRRAVARDLGRRAERDSPRRSAQRRSARLDRDASGRERQRA